MHESVPRASRKQAPKAFPAAGAASAGPPPGASSLLFLRGRDADARIRRLVAARHACRPALEELARQLVKRRAHEPLGLRSLGDYVRERLGLTAHGVRGWARVWEALETLPHLRAAVIGGEVSWTVARLAVAHATPESDVAFATSLRHRTVRAAESMLRAAFGDLSRAAEACKAPRGAAAVAADVSRRSAPHEPSREHGLRQEAFPHLRWDGAASAGDTGPLQEASLRRLEAFAVRASPHALDRALRRLLRRLQCLEHDLGHLLRQVLDRRLHCELGFARFEHYVEERADLSPRTARRWVRLARLGPVGSAVANAFRGFGLTRRQAVAVAESAPPAATALHLAKPAGPAPDAAAALGWMLDHALATWAAAGERFHDYADFARDGWHCTVAGCTARRNLQSHHVVFRSRGGAVEPWNRTTLCAFHHLRGVHAHRVSCQGRAPDGLAYALGLRASGPPLLRARAGDVLVR